MTLVLEGRLDPATAPAAPYVYLPFDVPAGVTRIDVRYAFEEPSILDLGLTDPRIGAFPSREGFRGWSGSARRHVFVATDDATPGYVAGDLPAGRWQVVLGLAALDGGGCAYRVEVELDDAPRAHATPAAARDVSLPGSRWYRGDLHSHTHFSDARGSLEDLVRAARARGLEFLAVTDHNTAGHHAPVRAASDPELLLVPGEEVTTYRGHANVWGAGGWVDFRLGGPKDVQELVRHVHGRGGLIAVNHPHRSPRCIGCDWEWPMPDDLDAFEVWNGPWAYRNWEALERCDALLRAGSRPTLVGGSDRHQPGWPDEDPTFLWVGSPTTWFYLPELSEAALLAGLASGRAFVSEGPDGPRLELTVGGATMGSCVAPGAFGEGGELTVEARVVGARGALLRYVGAAGTVREIAVEDDEARDVWRWRPDGAFLRAEIVAVDDEPDVRAAFEALRRRGRIPFELTLDEILAHPRVRALTNPVYVNDAAAPG